MIDILAISGSLRRGSFNTALARHITSIAPADVAVEVVRLNAIPLYDGDLEDASGRPSSVLALQKRIAIADGVIIATPEYNFSIPGVLKNALDWVSRGERPFYRKAVGVVGASGGPIGTARSQYHLRQNLQGLEAQVMPKPEVFVTDAESKFDADGHLTDAPTTRRVAAWMAAYVEWVRYIQR